MEVTVIGKIYEENWVDRDGEKRTSVEINADAISVTTFTLSKDLKSSSPEDVFPSYKNLSDVPF
jgi:single-stranded DNA-binding protein